MPDSQPWYSVIRPREFWSRASASHRCQRTRSAQRRSRNASATARVDRPRVRAWSRMRCTAIACTGGCVMPDVCRVRGALAASAERGPAGRPGEVAVDAVGEHDVRDHPVGPLRREQGVELDDGPLDAQRRQSDRHERRVPAPHVRVQQRRRGGHHAQVVAAQQIRGAGRELRRSEAGIGWHPFHHATSGRSLAQVGRVTAMPTAMITGAGGGLGSAIADALAPTHTLFLAGRPSERLDDARRAVRRHHLAGRPRADLDAIPAVVEPIVELDVLIHNAGVAYPGRVAESTVDEWRSHHEVNVVGAVALTLAAAARAAGRRRSRRLHQLRCRAQRLAGTGVVFGEQVRAARVRRLAARRRARAAGHVGVTPAASTPTMQTRPGRTTRAASTTPPRFLSPRPSRRWSPTRSTRRPTPTSTRSSSARTVISACSVALSATRHAEIAERMTAMTRCGYSTKSSQVKRSTCQPSNAMLFWRSRSF